MRFHNILCPIDFSEFSVTAYHYAVSLAEHYNANLVVLHAMELRKYPYADYVVSTGNFASFSKALCEGGDSKLREFLKKHPRDGVELQANYRSGKRFGANFVVGAKCTRSNGL